MKKLKENGFSHVEGLLILVAISLIGGVGYYVYSQQQVSQSSTPQASVATVDTLPDNLDEVLPIEEVQKLAKESNADGVISNIELTTEDGTLVYIVSLTDGSVLGFNALSGVSVVVDDDGENEEDSRFPSTVSAKISLSNAVAIAKKERPGVQVEKVEIEFEDGVLVYSVRFVDDGRVDIDANNGSVIEVRKEQGKKVKERGERRGDDDFDDDGQPNKEDRDDDNDGKIDDEDDDDDNDGAKDDEDDDDDNDDIDDDEDDDEDEKDDDDKEDRSGSNSGSN